jgi:RNA polymerase sigma-70 factor (ECF subfamily)
MTFGATTMETDARRAWQELDDGIRRFIRRRVASSADADDLTQEVLTRVQRSLPTLRDEQRLGPWVFQIARHAIVDYRRRSARAMPLMDPDEAASSVEAPESDDVAEQALAACIAPFVARLSSPYREALTLTEMEGVTHRQAAEMLEVSLPAMKSRVLRGKQQLRAMLEACCSIALDPRGGVRECDPRSARCGGERGCG